MIRPAAATAERELADIALRSKLAHAFSEDPDEASDRVGLLHAEGPFVDHDPSFAQERTDGARFVASLVLSLAAARALKSDGRLEDAARESLQVAETVVRWPARMLAP